MSWALGVDGGNTKTLALVADAEGRVRGRGRGGCADIYNAATPAAALDEIERAAAAALADAGLEGPDLEAAAFSLAGADWPEDFALLERALAERLGLRAPPIVVNDALGALRAGSPEWTGIAVVAGTYNAVGARHPDGRVFHLGFWPDGAGGRDLAREGLRAVYRAGLGIGRATALTARALALWAAPDETALLYAFTRRGGLPEGEQDRFAPVVLDAAEEGDAVAGAIVAAKGRALGLQARASAERVGLPTAGTRVVLTGRVFDHPGRLLAAAALAELPGAEPVRGAPPPVAGALMLAQDRAGAGSPSTIADDRSARWAASASSA